MKAIVYILLFSVRVLFFILGLGWGGAWVSTTFMLKKWFYFFYYCLAGGSNALFYVLPPFPPFLGHLEVEEYFLSVCE